MSDEEWESGEWRMKSGEWYGMDGMVWYGTVDLDSECERVDR